MIQDLQLIKDLLQTGGMTAFLLFLVFAMWRSWPSLKSAGKEAGKIATWGVNQYVDQIKERIALETKIDLRLAELAVSLERYTAELRETERRRSDMILTFKDEAFSRLHNIEIVIADRIFPALNDLKNLFEDHIEDFEDKVRDGHDCKKMKLTANMGIPSYLVDTEEFRQLREQQRKEKLDGKK